MLSYDNEEMKDAIIADALRVSMSIPGVFKAPQLYFKKNGERVVDTSGDVWTDGGAMDNFPVDCFDDKKYLDVLLRLKNAN